MRNLVIITMIALAVGSGEALAQATRVPVGIRLTLNSAEARLGAKVPLTVSLKNFKGEPVPANERFDMTIESSLPATIERVTIPVGKDSVTAAIVFQRAGIAKLKASSGKLSPGYGVISITQKSAATAPAPAAGLRLVAFREPPAFAVTTGLKLGLKALASRVVPRNRVWSVTGLVAVLNERGEGVRVTEDLPIRLASTLGTVVPDALVISRGESAKFVQVTSSTSGLDTISALSPSVEGKAEEQVEYEQFRASKLLLISTPSEVITNGRTNASITVLLRDEDDHVVAVPDRDTRVVLQTNFGSLSTAATTIARGRPDSEPIVLTSARAGRATITAIAEGLGTDSKDVSFVLPFLLIGLASAGGVGGALLRTQRGRRREQLGRSLALGAFLGAIFFALGMMGVPGMIPAIPLQTLEHLTFNEVGACLLGICGGYIGRRFLDDLLVKKSGGTHTGMATA
jgi:hypothetical protein